MESSPESAEPLVTREEPNEAFWQGLGIASQEIAALKRQGFVRCETRGDGAVVFKLRFRLAGRQRVKFLGRDAEHAARVAQELALLQQPRQFDKRLRKLNQEAAKRLRLAKQHLIPVIEQAGFRFHGRAIRRPRSAVLESNNKPQVKP